MSERFSLFVSFTAGTFQKHPCSFPLDDSVMCGYELNVLWYEELRGGKGVIHSPQGMASQCRNKKAISIRLQRRAGLAMGGNQHSPTTLPNLSSLNLNILL